MLDKASRIFKRAGERLLKTPQQLKLLDEQGDNFNKQLARAIKQGIYRTYDPAEQAWVEKIEALRAELLKSSETLVIQDFGAGDFDDVYDDEAAQQGVEKTVTVGKSCAASSSTRRWSGVLYKLIYVLKLKNAVELGTHMGISAAYQSAALELNGAGRLITLEGAKAYAQLATRNLTTLGLAHRVEIRIGRFQDTLQDALTDLRPVDYAFIDGHHEEKATIGYFETILPYLNDEAILVFDDHRWNASMKRAWETVTHHARVHTAVDMPSFGICRVSKTTQETRFYEVV